ncbi:MAG: hypothetical protein A2790_19840 [Phenylobacterium sp. RIFCSPHIGHO2_01_FULL_69_31]|nr:MAG: hypothetical protein A2790_19840 [Phenylobacterium sp. RIFCSPHIGHO2_01_FULL_69_31]
MAAILAAFDEAACGLRNVDLSDLPGILRSVLLNARARDSKTGLSDLEYHVARIVTRKLFTQYNFVEEADRFLAAAEAAVDRLTLNEKFLDAFDPRRADRKGENASLIGFVVQQVYFGARDILDRDLGLKRPRKGQQGKQENRDKGPPNGASPGTASQARAGPVEAPRGPDPRNSHILSASLDEILDPQLHTDQAGTPDVRGREIDGNLELIPQEDGGRVAARDGDDVPDQPVSLDEDCAGRRRQARSRQGRVLRRLLHLTPASVDDTKVQALAVVGKLVSLDPLFFPEGEDGVCDRLVVKAAAGQKNVSQWATRYVTPVIVQAAITDPAFKADLLRLCEELEELEASYKRRDDAKPKRAKTGLRRDPTKAWTTLVFHLFETTSIRKALEGA